MEKPQKQVWFIYDYHECRNYLENKFGYDERDYAGHFIDENLPYKDFWHFVVDKGGVTNDSTFVMSEWWFEDAEDWQREIGTRYLDEFGEGEPGDRSILFCVSW